MITKLYKIINFILNLIKYYDKDSEAYDETIKDHRDFASGTTVSFEDMEDIFILDDNRRLSQWATPHCTAYSVDWACNSELWIKADKDLFYNWDDLAQKMISNWTMTPRWAWVIDAIKEKKAIWEIDSYYQVNTNVEIMTAISRYTNPVATGSNNINRSKLGKDKWLLLETTPKSSWHAFSILGWDKNKKVWWYIWAWYCKNSWGGTWGDKGWFWVPFELTNKTFFNTKKALVLTPDWSSDTL